jgi:hypothetical protein
MVARSHLPDTEAGIQTFPKRSDRPTQTLGGPTASKRRDVARPCARMLPWWLRSSLVHDGLYALLQCGEDSEYGRKAYDGYFEVFRVLLVEDSESSPPASENFQSAAA